MSDDDCRNQVSQLEAEIESLKAKIDCLEEVGNCLRSVLDRGRFECLSTIDLAGEDKGSQTKDKGGMTVKETTRFYNRTQVAQKILLVLSDNCGGC